ILGPVVAGVLIFAILALTSPVKAVFAIIVFVLVQQIENNILTPVLSKKFVGLSPSLVLLSFAVGGALGGMWGAVLGIPLLGISLEFVKEFVKRRKEETEEN
ncbi:MAG: AI-2E family transporter, partial [bacterium]|nr:AI-2E family transporter [bacterium]